MKTQMLFKLILFSGVLALTFAPLVCALETDDVANATDASNVTDVDKDTSNTVSDKGNSTNKEIGSLFNLFQRFHQDTDRIFDQAFGRFGPSPLGFNRTFLPSLGDEKIKPPIDMSANEKEYNITVEIPNVDEKDVQLEIVDGTLTIRGEKKQEKEEKESNYYRMERSYGSFQRVLSLPEDANQDDVKATFKNGVLTITLPKKELAKPNVKKIEIKSN